MSPFHREKNWGTVAPDFCITLELASGKAEVTHFWILGLGFSPPIQQPLICMSKSNVKPAPCLSSSCPRMRRSKACHVILRLRNQLLLSLNHLSRRQGGQQTPILFLSWPATGCLTFCKSLNCSVTLCEMRMEELWSPTCLRGWLYQERWVEMLRTGCSRHLPGVPSGWPDT